jgi:DNA-binding IclR family transcriptional regulator
VWNRNPAKGGRLVALDGCKENASIEALDRGLKILNLFAEKGRELGLTEIAALLGEHKSTVYRTLATLESRGFVERGALSKRYWVGVSLFTLGSLYQSRMEIRRVARPLAECLANRFEETVHLGILDEIKIAEGKIVVLDKIETSHPLRLTPSIGAEADAHACGVGKAILAYQDEKVVQDIVKRMGLKRYTSNTITALEDLQRELARVRDQGYALDEQELEIGLRCVAAPIFNRSGRAVASVSLSGPTARLLAERMPQIIEGVKDTARSITERLNLS